VRSEHGDDSDDRTDDDTHPSRSDANVLYDLRARIMSAGILDPTDITNAAEAYFGVDPEKRSLEVIHANLDPAVGSGSTAL
jgi:hypothetical protein